MQSRPVCSNPARAALCLAAALTVFWSVINTSALPVVWINEIHYDNTGTDVGEFIEIAGVAGTAVDGYQLVLYNAGNGLAYSTKTLSGVIADQQNGFGTLAFTFTGGIQNGSPDGFALVSPVNEIQFLSYEGVFTALGGPALGIESTDIGVFEAGTEPVGLSLLLTGSGSGYADFTWSGPATASPGSINPGQFFTVQSPVESVPDGGATLGLLAMGLAGLRGLRRLQASGDETRRIRNP
jgi:hypothetical protein